MNKKIFLKGKIGVEKANGKVTVIASDETLDRHGDVLPIDQWDLSKFLLSPRMLIDHNHEVASIVGRWNNTRIVGNKLLMDADFHEITDISKAVKQMVEEGYLDTVSVGFIYNDPTADGGRPSFELIETSWVTVPANPSARVQASFKSALEKTLTEEQVKEIEDFAGDIEESDDVLPEDDDEQPIAEEGEEVEQPAEPAPSDEEDITDDRSMNAMEAKGWLVIRSQADYDEWQASHAGGNAISLCDSIFLEKLLKRSEQLETLTHENQAKVEADKKAKLARMALKEAAGFISHALREMNKNS